MPNICQDGGAPQEFMEGPVAAGLPGIPKIRNVEKFGDDSGALEGASHDLPEELGHLERVLKGGGPV